MNAYERLAEELAAKCLSADDNGTPCFNETKAAEMIEKFTNRQIALHVKQAVVPSVN